MTVLWKDGTKAKYHFGNGVYEIKEILVINLPVEEQYKQPVSWVIGKRVKRGRDWKRNDEDGGEGKLGTVIEETNDKWVSVRWDASKDEERLKSYCWWENGLFDLEVVFTEEDDTKDKKIKKVKHSRSNDDDDTLDALYDSSHSDNDDSESTSGSDDSNSGSDSDSNSDDDSDNDSDSDNFGEFF